MQDNQLINRFPNVTYDELEIEEAQPIALIPTRKPKQPLKVDRIYGRQAFATASLPLMRHASFFISGVEAAMVSAIFATGSIDWLAKLITSSFPELSRSDSLAIIGLFIATPGFLLFRGGTHDINEEILKRCTGFRYYDLVSLGITRRWFDSAYNHDSKWSYVIEAVVLPFAQFSIFVSPASGLSLASMVNNDRNFILTKFIPHNQVLRLVISSICGYLPIAVLNGATFSLFVDNILNKIANILADSQPVAKKRKELINFLQGLAQANYDSVDKNVLLMELSKYRQVMINHSGIALVERQIRQLIRLQDECNIQSAKLDWSFCAALPYIGAIGLSSIATISTMVFAGNLIKTNWFLALTDWLSGWSLCGLGSYIGLTAAAVSWPLNFSACVAVLQQMINLLKHPRAWLSSMVEMDYYDGRNFLLTLLFSLFSAIITFTLTMQSTLKLDPQCGDYLGFMQPVLETLFPVINFILPVANFGVGYALAFQSISEFLNERLLKPYKTVARNADSLEAMRNREGGDERYARRSFEAAKSMLVVDINRLSNYFTRAPSHQIDRLPSLEDIRNDREEVNPISGRAELRLSQNRYQTFSSIEGASVANTEAPIRWYNRMPCNIL